MEGINALTGKANGGGEGLSKNMRRIGDPKGKEKRECLWRKKIDSLLVGVIVSTEWKADN